MKKLCLYKQTKVAELLFLYSLQFFEKIAQIINSSLLVKEDQPGQPFYMPNATLVCRIRAHKAKYSDKLLFEETIRKLQFLPENALLLQR